MLNFLNAIHNQPVTHTPVWFMRQAGRYLPEYRELRAGAGSFLTLCKTPELAAIATLQPLKRFSVDAAILFSDILVVPEALGMELDFIEGVGPKFSQALCSEMAIDKLAIEDLETKLDYVASTIKCVQAELSGRVPLIGFSGSPFTLACYMLEGGSSREYTQMKQWLYAKPQALHHLLDKLTQAVITYLKMQIEAGVNVIMLFDSWGGILPSDVYAEFSLAYMAKIIAAVGTLDVRGIDGNKIPSIMFTKGGGNWLTKMAAVSPNCIALDYMVDMAVARKSVPSHIALQGNLDPALLAFGDRSSLKQAVSKILTSYRQAHDANISGHNVSGHGVSGHIFNLGHGVLPQTNPDNVAYVVNLVHELSQ